MIGVLLALFQLSTALNEIAISSAEQSSSRDATSPAGKAIDGDISTSSYTVEHEKSWITLKLNTPRKLNKVVIKGQAAAACNFEVYLILNDGSTKFFEEYTVAGLYNKNVKFWGSPATAINISEKTACPQTMQMYEIKVFGPCEKGCFSAPEEIGRYTLVGQPWNNMTKLICTECAPVQGHTVRQETERKTVMYVVRGCGVMLEQSSAHHVLQGCGVMLEKAAALIACRNVDSFRERDRFL